MTKKICEQCQAEKELELFHKVTNQYTALHPMGICKECYKSNNEERKRRQAQEWEARTAGRRARDEAYKQAGQRWLPSTEGNPTEVSNHAWIYALRQQGSYPVKTERSGKWLIFLSAETIDRYWQKVKAAVEQGQLGAQAKVSTLSKGSMPPEVRRKKEERGDTRFVICVYTYDHEDKGDVMRIREVLRDLGIRRPIRYKADADTHAGSYGNDYHPMYEA